ncbi:MAG: cytochrome c biogenesis protein ResB [Elusimicrobia bacterium]|nr:cytochrome c biogenesis protein ResB [Elusimicrobiota bacterium]
MKRAKRHGSSNLQPDFCRYIGGVATGPQFHFANVQFWIVCWRGLASLKLTLACLGLLMVLVVLCTLAQVHLGTLGAVDRYIRSFFVTAPLPWTPWQVPVFPGGALVGLLLLVNLVAAHAQRLELSWRKAGMWAVHFGLLLLVLGEFMTGLLSVESQMAIEEGQTLNYIESPGQVELEASETTGIGRTYQLAVRPKRRLLPFSITLKDFTHERYPGTEIPKNFSSLIRLKHPEKNEDRDVLISMNNPLRYEGLAFYQASFGKEDTLSVLQVVQNPAWLLPYLACVLISLGLLFHFLLRLSASTKPRRVVP